MPSSIPASRAYDFTQSIGVNTHISWKNPGSAYADPGVALRSLAYLGIAHVRDGVPYNGWTLPEYVALAKAGVRFDIVASGPAIDIAGDLAQISRLAAAAPGSVAAIEGANEFNTGSYTLDGTSSHGHPDWSQYYGPKLYEQAKAAPALSGVSVIAPSMANASAADLQQYGNVSAFADSANWHVYYGNGDQPYRNLADGIARARSAAPGKPVTVTETGYYTAIDAMDWGGGGVSPSVQAVLTVNALLDAFKLGASRTYLYELLDNIASPASNDLEDTFGLFLADGTPKPAAAAIHNLTAILADPPSTAALPGVEPLSATFKGLPSTGASLLLQKASGAQDLVVWNEPKLWDQATRSALNLSAAAVTVKLGSAYGVVKVFDPLLGTAPIQTLANADTVQLALSSHPYVIEVTPLTIGAGPDALVLRLQQDAYQGNAQYVVSIDGQQVGGTLTAHATRAAGQFDTVMVRADLAPGKHWAEVRFLNDAYAGTPDTDRNLFVSSASYDGAAVANAARSLYSQGSAFISFNETTVIPA